MKEKMMKIKPSLKDLQRIQAMAESYKEIEIIIASCNGSSEDVIYCYNLICSAISEFETKWG